MIGRIGRYELQAELGRGGFGQVYRAHDPIVGRSVAIKILVATGDPDLLVRFRNEAGATGKLRHRNIVVIYDFGEHEGVPYLVMELLEGQDLERIISSHQPMSLPQKVDVMRQMVSGLHHAHSRGIVHRDVKPANVMLSSDGTVKIMDFGIALLNQATAARITPQGSLIGTFPYMAPEQFHGEASDPLTDIFALGVTSYKLLTGVHPFSAQEMASLMFNIVNKTPEPIRTLLPECPEALEMVISRLLAKDRDGRYQSLEDTLFDLEPIGVDLRKEQVEDLVSRSRSLIEKNELPQAQSLIREALEIEPGSKSVRELREHVQQLIKEKTVRPRVEALVETGRQFLRVHSYDQAIQKFESALKLDKSNEYIRQLIKEAQDAWERRQQADRHVKEAQNAMAAGDLTAARKSVEEAISASPDHESANELLENLRRKVEARERENQLREGLSRAKRLMLLESIDTAIELLVDLQQSFPDSTEVQRILKDARADQENRIRVRELQSGTDDVKAFLKEQRFGEAEALLSRLLLKFPESKELSTLFNYAAEEQRIRLEARAVEAISSDAQELISRGSFDEAIDKLRYAMRVHPNASSLRDLLQSTEYTKAERARADALEQAVSDVKRLLARKAFAQAQDRISAFVAAYDDSPALAPLRRSAEQGLEKLRRVAAARNILLEAQGLIDEDRPGAAQEVLQRATLEFPEEAEISSLLGVAYGRLRQQEDSKEISRVISEAESLARARRFDEAFGLLDQRTTKYSGDQRLRRCREAMEATRKAFQLEQSVAQAVSAATRLAAGGSLEAALDEISSAIATLGNREPLTEAKSDIEKQISARKQQQFANQRIREAQALLEREDPFSAAQVLEGIPKDYSDPEVQRLRKIVEESIRSRELESEISRCAAEISAARKAGDLDLAGSLAQSAFQRYPASQSIRAEHDLILQEKQRKEALSKLLGTASSLAESGQFLPALKVLDGASNSLALEGSVISLRRRIASRYDIEQVVSRAERLRDEKDINGALNILVDGVIQHPGEPKLLALHQQLVNLKAEAQKQEAIDRSIDRARLLAQGGEYESALVVLKDSLASSPTDARLADLHKQIERELRDRNRARRLEAVRVEAEEHLRSGEVAKAVSLIEGAEGAMPALAGLLEQARTVQKRETHDNLLREAHQLCEESRFEEALSLVKRAVVQFGSSPAWTDLRARLENEINLQHRREEKELAAIRLRALVQNAARRRIRTQPLRQVQREANEIRASYPNDSDFVSLANRVDENVQLAHTRVRKTRTALAAVCLGLLLVAGIGLLILRSTTLVPVEVRTDPPNATVTFGSRSCTTPACSFGMKAGNYRLSATLHGYQTIQRSVSIHDAQGRYVFDLVFQPIPPPPPTVAPKGLGRLQLQTGQASALVFVDGTARGRTDGHGMFSIQLSADRHSFDVEKNGFLPSTVSTVSIEKDRTQRILVSLNPVPPPKVTSPKETASGKEKAPAPTPQVPPNKPPSPEQLAEQEWQKAYASHDASQLRSFLAKYPGTPHLQDAQMLIDDLDWSHVNTSDQQSLSSYVSRYPNGRHVAEANNRIADLAWMNVDKGSERAIRQYLQQFPNSDHRHEAELAISTIQAQAAAAKPRPPIVDHNQASGAGETVSFGVDSALAQFNAAFQHKQPKEVRRIWAGVPAQYTDAMRLPGATFLMSLKPVEQIEVSGDSASVVCDLLISTTIRGQSPSEKRKRVKVRLQKVGDAWAILDPLGS
ncbi:MAG TPA: protein kinase [Bryobacteraceae bacterium]|jgi:serine/threonine-protein kinase|nr:protein kinase [Bryobacteraceae bacterium]